MFRISKQDKNKDKDNNKNKRPAVMNGFVKRIRVIELTFIFMFVVFIIMYVKINIDNRDEKSSVETENFISGQLEELQELAVSKVIYDGVVEMEDNSGFFKKKFYIKYTGYVKSYVDLSEADVEVDEKRKSISVRLPHAVIGEPNIDTNYQIYDRSWIKSDSIEATTKALERAEEDCKRKVDEKTMIDTADGYAKEAVENLLSSFTELDKPYSCEVEWI